MDELITPTPKPKTGADAFSEAYSQTGQEEATAENVLAVLEAEAARPKGSLSQLSDYYRETAAANAEAKDKAARQVLTDEELEGAPEEVKEIYNKYLSSVFELEGVKVTTEDPEWMYIAAEIDNPAGSLALTMIAAKEAAQLKKQRLQKMTWSDHQEAASQQMKANAAAQEEARKRARRPA